MELEFHGSDHASYSSASYRRCKSEVLANGNECQQDHIGPPLKLTQEGLKKRTFCVNIEAQMRKERKSKVH